MTFLLGDGSGKMLYLGPMDSWLSTLPTVRSQYMIVLTETDLFIFKTLKKKGKKKVIK